jgi:hypothetical protein
MGTKKMSRGKDTVIQNAGRPDPEDETYLSLLKGTVSPSEKMVKVKVKKENSGFMTPFGGKTPPDQSRETYANLLKNTVKVQRVKTKKDSEDEDLKKQST